MESIFPVLGNNSPDSLVHILVKRVIPESNSVEAVQVKSTVLELFHALFAGLLNVTFGGYSTFKVLLADDFSEVIGLSSVSEINVLVCVAEQPYNKLVPSAILAFPNLFIVKFATISVPTD